MFCASTLAACHFPVILRYMSHLFHSYLHFISLSILGAFHILSILGYMSYPFVPESFTLILSRLSQSLSSWVDVIFLQCLAACNITSFYIYMIYSSLLNCISCPFHSWLSNSFHLLVVARYIPSFRSSCYYNICNLDLLSSPVFSSSICQ